MNFKITLCFVLGTPGYVPPVANFDGESTDMIAPSTTAPLNKTKKGKRTIVEIFYTIAQMEGKKLEEVNSH